MKQPSEIANFRDLKSFYTFSAKQKIKYKNFCSQASLRQSLGPNACKFSWSPSAYYFVLHFVYRCPVLRLLVLTHTSYLVTSCVT